MGIGFFEKNVHVAMPARLVLVCFILLTLAACSDSKQIKVQPGAPAEDDSKGKSQEERLSTENWKMPIKVPEGEFFKVFGWLDDSTLIYASNLESTSNLYSYSLEKGESSLIVQTDHPIAEVSLNQDRTMILVHTSSSSYEAIVDIYSIDGIKISGQSFPSTELHAEWNPYRPTVASIVAFNDDWTFHAYRMDAAEKTVEEMTLPDPFVEWIGENKIAYLDWNEETPSITAPIVLEEIGEKAQIAGMENIYRIESFKNALLTVSADGGNTEKAVFTFYDKELKEYNSFSMPHLSSFSGWLVPYMDFNEEKKLFAVFEPARSGEADTYTEGFTLVVHSERDSSGRRVFMEGIDNQPILSSPNGKVYLYGFRYEKIIDIETKKILHLVKE
ncbi:hypothetical protein [Bacillus sp. B-jedd]|uniref:YqgU-like beta propeller domain-containing protein n=1 Tax=Bacillus sp. B-jedd TaxID=1476857 RepID=UPI0005155C67|nr:hypothetical protein [Bacillus sp. B-jedd]CEG27855.1 putative lipoprotein [Bacillus sp. B-jedd]